jgi:protein arginine N-methyltransferase 2
MTYISSNLTFSENKISYLEGEIEWEVMMDWEDNIMSASAAYVCTNGGNILEIGFGMGISAGYIQSHAINSHTIIENHPDIIPRAQTWAADKSNVTIVEGSWFDVKDSLSTYDGSFSDCWGDDNSDHYYSFLPSIMKPGGRATWWNGFTGSDNYYGIPGITYKNISVSPPPNCYFNHSNYLLPKKQF